MNNIKLFFLAIIFTISCISAKTNILQNVSNIPVFDTLRFQKIVIEGEGRFFISVTQSNQDKLEINASKDLLDLITITNQGNCLIIKGEMSLSKYKKQIDINIKVKNLNSIDLKKGMKTENLVSHNNPTSIKFENVLSGDSLKINGEGKVLLTGNLHYNYVQIKNSGILKCDLAGHAKSLYLNIDGMGTFKANDLEVINGLFDVNGITKIKINQVKYAKINANGIHYINTSVNFDINI